MKTLELNQMETIRGAGFWDGFCSGMLGAVAGVGVAAVLAVAIPGASIIVAVAGVGCFAASINTD